MIKFFRNLRRQLIRENKFTRYLIYAVGEIILVVIGILIALQINDWNDRRKILNEENATIASLQLEFEKNLTDLKYNMDGLELFIQSGRQLLQHTGPNYSNGTLKNVDSLISMTSRMVVWDPSLYTLTSIKNSGKLSSLSNEDLKVKLIEWESFYSNLLDWGDFYVERGHRYFDYLESNSINRNLSSGERFNLEPSRFEGSNEDLMRLKSFESILTNRVVHHGFMLGFYKEAEVLLNEIIKECETYE
ncbi:MAG TPA: DUF6090 family protein [Christiangramia sp.]|nr:DUF6090 family protein [Christiangramia sp.]